MRITGCHIKAFGRFRDERFDQFDHPAVVMLGDNETGKTTLRHFITTMLYGIAPGQAREYPYVPRDGRVLEGRMAYRRGDGTALDIGRRLDDYQPQAHLVDEAAAGTQQKSLHDRCIPAAQHVPRAVFEAVYSLSVGDLEAGIGGEALAVLQGRLLQSLAAASVRPARQVAAEVNREAEALWHPDSAVASASQDVEKRLDELAEEIAGAQEAERQARRLLGEVRALEHEIEEGWREQEALRVQLRRIERLAPVQQLLAQMEELRDQVGEPERRVTLPDEPREAIRRQKRRITEQQSALEEQRRKISTLEERAGQLTDQDRLVLKRETAIETWMNKVEAHERWGARLHEARQEKREARRRLEDVAERLLSEPWHNDLAPAVRGLSMGDLRQRMRDYEQAVDELEEGKAHAGGMRAEAAGTRGAVWPWLLLTVLGVVVWYAGRRGAQAVPQAAPLGFILAAVGALQAAAGAWRTARGKRTGGGALALEERRAVVEEKAALVVEYLSALPLPQERLQHLDRDLLHDLQHLFEALRAHDERAERVQEGAAAQLEANQAVEAVAAASEVPADTHEMGRTVMRLARRLEGARAHRRAARAARDQLPDRREQAQRHERRLAEAEKQLATWTKTLKALGDGDVDAGHRVLYEQREAARRLRRVTDRLHQEFPDWKARRDELHDFNGFDEAPSDAEQSRLQTRIQALADRINQLRRQRDDKREKLNALDSAPSSADLASERADLQAHLQASRQRRDQLLLLRNLIREGHRRFRERHQPNVLHTASDFARRITGGRLERVTLDDETWNLRAEAGKNKRLVSAPPLSRGTLNQIQLAFRLAVVHHLDEAQERLPLLLDEVFVNWDTARRRKAFEVLNGMTSGRQIFVFTCHPYFAREAADFLEGKMIRLSA